MGVRIRNWFDDVRDAAGGDPAFGLLFGAYYAFVGCWLTVSTRMRLGTPVYERDWDLLVVLDACRTDALAAVSDEYDFLGDVETIWSMGSTSGEWLAHTFDRDYADEVGRTAYVTANPHSGEVLRRRNVPPQYVSVPATWPAWNPVEVDAFRILDEVWQYGREDRLGVVPPETVTDRAIAVGRETDADRLIVHYMQPHAPYIAEVVGTTEAVSPLRAEPLERLQRGAADPDAVWRHYLDNLRLVLDRVEVLLENVDAERVAITADHGEAFGEWGFYEHPVGCPHPAVRRVPWVETTAVDRGTYQPAVEAAPGDSSAPDSEPDVRSHLRDLGYL